MNDAGHRLTRRPPAPIPLTLLTGFLGAGKTTLLNRLVRAPSFARSVVIVNEFGDVAIDHLLVEQADGGLLTLASGCICCTVRGDLVEMLEDLLRRRDNARMAPFDRVIVETTGLAEPGPILNAVALHPYLALRYRADGVVAVVDALHGPASLDAHHEAALQVALADVLVLTKTDLVDDDSVAAIRARLAACNPRARILDAARQEATPDAILGAALDLGAAAGQSTREHHHDHHHHHHDDGLGSLVLRAETPLDPAAVEMFLTLLRAQHGAALLRFKGLVALADDPDRPLLIQGVQQTLHPPRRLDAWPDADRSSRLVAIGRRLDGAAIERLWAAFFAAPAIDQPDAAALAAGRDGGSGLF